jgi:hypothetical protein
MSLFKKRDIALASGVFIVNDLNNLTSIRCHCERSEAISWDCHVASAPRNDYFSKSFTIVVKWNPDLIERGYREISFRRLGIHSIQDLIRQDSLSFSGL